MGGPVLLCTDGSDGALAALAAGLDLLGPGRELLLVTVVEPEDPTLVTGAGFQGSVMTPDEYDAMAASQHAAAERLLDSTARQLGLDPGGDAGPGGQGQVVERRVLEGSVGPAICAAAHDLQASAIVMGTRGRRGLRRALLGSVSDHVVRHAHCPVLITDHLG